MLFIRTLPVRIFSVHLFSHIDIGFASEYICSLTWALDFKFLRTTAFYPGTVSQAPRKASGGGSFAMVSFKDDHDEHGITHDKAILLKYIMLPP